jgi:hypothetical protein
VCRYRHRPAFRCARARELGRTYRLGSLSPLPRDGLLTLALWDGLNRLGFIEGQNLTDYPRGYGLRTEQFAEVAAELVKAKVDVIVALGNPAIRAAQQATSTIPILAVTDDMVGSGLVRSLARPGGNTTGISIFATELDGKRQEILIEMVPGARHIAALADSNTRRLSSSMHSGLPRGHMVSSCRFTRSPSLMRSSAPSTRRMRQALPVSTCWPRRY